ncbi:MAG TPA: DUF3857 domain-containing protein [Saprospiraceae bacterium]|nr:DUF3857 domain-containing protein [Saprospiraceae bacterium]
MTASLLILWVFVAFQAIGKDDRPELNVALIAPEMIKDAYSVVRESVTTCNIATPKNYTLHVKEAVTILDKRSQYDALTVPYDQYSKARIISASIYDQFGGLIRNIKKDEIQDISAFGDATLYSDNRFLGVQLVGGSFPYSVAYSYEIQYHATMYYPDWDTQTYHTSIEESEFYLIHPQSLEIVTMPMNGVLAEKDTANAPGMRLRKWSAKGLCAIRIEEFAPPAHEIFPAVLIAPASFEVDQYIGTMKNWKGFGKFIYDLNLDREKLSPQMAFHVHQMILETNDDFAKIQVLYDYLKSTMRYVSVQLGIGGWQAYDAAYVERNKYGDCKALSYFMKGMLAEAGIEAYPALVPAGRPSFFIDEFVTPGSFNHMMLYVPEHDLWLECTSNMNPTGYISDVTSDRDVLLITPEGGVKARTPSRALDQSSILTMDSLFVQDDTWHIVGRHVFTGGAHEVYRYWQKDLAPSEQEKRFREEFTLSIRELEELQYAVEPNEPVATCTYVIDLAQYGSLSGNRLFLPLNPLYRFESPCVSDTRIHDIFREYPIIERNTMKITIPEGYQVESIPSTRTVDTRFGKFYLEVTQPDKILVIERSLQIPRTQVDADAYSEMCAFNKTIESADKGTVVLKKNSP